MSQATATHWEHRTAQEWRELWQLPALTIYDEVGSTNDVIRQRAIDGAPAGLVVIAERQRSGRGRMGRQWLAEAGSSLLFSLIVRPDPTEDPSPGTLPIRVGMAVAQALRDATGIAPTLKWPNDVVIGNHSKLAGILCEGVAADRENGFVIVGVGINVHQRPDDWPPALRATATSIDACTGRRADRAALAQALNDALRPLWTAPLQPLTRHEIERYAGIDALGGMRVDIRSGNHAYTATADGIAPDGALVVIRDDGVRDRVTSATIRRAVNVSLQGSP